MENYYEKLRLAMLGQASGDSFGAPFEYNEHAGELAEQSIRERRYLDAHKDVGTKLKWCRLPGLYTDDTQQALALVRARLDAPNIEQAAALFKSIIRDMATQKIEHAVFGLHRGTGGNFRQAVLSGNAPKTAGLGGPMRVGPVAVMFDDPQELVEWVLAVTSVTTCDPVGLAVSAKFAAIAWAIAYPKEWDRVRKVEWPTDVVPEDVWEATQTALKVMRHGGEEALLKFGRETGWANKQMTCAANGFGLTGFAWAVDRAMTSQSFTDALIRVCSSGGDTDTVGAMAGCLAALKHGRGSIPAWMIDGLYGGRTFLWNPWEWRPEDELEPTQQDIMYRREVAAKVARQKNHRKQTEERRTLDLFEMAEEAEEQAEAARRAELEPVLFGSQGCPHEYRHFSNFAPRPFELDGERWATVEHYYQARKTDDPEWRKRIQEAHGPGEAKKLGRQCPIVEGWDTLKRDVMFGAVRAKFEHHSDLKKILLATGERPIHENRPDEWWGGGPNYPEGRDWLGQILVDLRDLFRGGG